ncbi:MAG: AraC family transcriptional regulator [Anaerorhabdus sp.]|uniref:AraC family transcriptional regulator n=1 Tax=Anaerorhabdus sp. TaxID=1872524 RepID=UPI002FC760A6
MSKLEVLENKKLVLKNVIKQEVRNISMEEIDTYLNKFLTKVELLKVQIFGPLVIKSIGVSVSEDGSSITTDYDLFLQAHDYKQYKNEFVIEDRHVCEHCAYLHFEGNPQDINYAHSKLDLYFYENDLSNNGTIYSVCIQDSEDYTIIDIFKPVLQI